VDRFGGVAMKGTHATKGIHAMPRLALRRQRGVSLIELMIGLTIGMVVVSAGVMVYTSSRVSSEAISEQNRMEEATRVLARLAQNTLSTAGFFGCQSRGGVIQNNINNPTGFLYNFNQPVFAYESNGSSFLNGPIDLTLSGASPAPLASSKSDILAVRAASSPVLVLDATRPAPGANGSIWLKANNALGNGATNSVAMITNCSRATAFVNTGAACANTASCQVTHNAGTTPAPGNSTTSLGFNYTFDAELLVPATIAYYVAGSSRCAAGAGGFCPSNSLYRKVGANAPEELIENVQAMKVSLLVDPGTGLNSGSRLFKPSAVSNWDQVVGMRVDFLITSSKPILPEAKTTAFAGANYTDKLARRVVSVSASLRNAMP
jgi:type IV pilus assembly protein PilW